MEIKNEFDDVPDFDRFFRMQDEIEKEEGEDWKPKPHRLAAKKLYEQGWRIMIYCKMFCESLKGEEAKDNAYLIMQNATIICPKIVGAEGGGIYILMMENASIIRTNMKELNVQLYASSLFEEANEPYAEVLMEEIEIFKSLFIDWVSHFKKDAVDDDWGLY